MSDLLSHQERLAGIGDPTLRGNRSSVPRPSNEEATADFEKGFFQKLQASVTAKCSSAKLLLGKACQSAKELAEGASQSCAASQRRNRTGSRPNQRDSLVTTADTREPSVSFESLECFHEPGSDEWNALGHSEKRQGSTCNGLFSGVLSRGSEAVKDTLESLRRRCKNKGKEKADGDKDKEKEGNQEEQEEEEEKEWEEDGVKLRAEIASWEYSRFFALVGLTKSVQKGSLQKFTVADKEKKWRKIYLVIIMLIIIFVFLSPFTDSVFADWANAEKLCVRRKAKIDDINAILAEKTRLQQAVEQMGTTKWIQEKTNEILEKGYVKAKPEKEPTLFKHAANPHGFYGSQDRATLSRYTDAAKRSNGLSSSDGLLFKMYLNFPDVCTVETIESLVEASYTRNCDLVLKWEDIEDQVMKAIHDMHDHSVDCRHWLKGSIAGRIRKESYGIPCGAMYHAIKTAINYDDYVDEITECDEVRYDLMREQMEKFFDKKRGVVLEEVPSFCNPKDSLVGRQVQAAYESYIKYSKRAAEQFQIPEGPEDPQGYFDEVRRQLDIIVFVWALFKVIRVILALPASPYRKPWFTVYRTPIVKLSPVVVAITSLILMNIATVLTTEGLFNGLVTAFNYFNDDPCNVMSSFTRERVALINQTCSALFDMSKKYIEAQYAYGITLKTMNLYKGCFSDFWQGLGVQGDCPLCNYFHEDFVICEDCDGNVTWTNDALHKHRMKPAEISLSSANAFMLQGFEGFCAPDVLETLYLKADDPEVYQYSGMQLLFFTGFILELALPILLLHFFFELFAVKNPSSVHTSSIEVTSTRFVLRPGDKPKMTALVRMKHEPCLCFTIILLICWVFLYGTFGYVETETPVLYAQPYSYLPQPLVNMSKMAESSFFFDTVDKMPEERGDIAGRWMCWGDLPESIPFVPFLGNYSASRSALCGLTVSGRIICMGRLTTAYHHSANAVSKEFPPQVQVSEIPLFEDFLRVATGETFACAIQRKSRKLTCWGKNIPGKFKLGESYQDRCGSEWFHPPHSIMKDRFSVDNNVGSFEASFYDAKFDDIQAGNYHICGYNETDRKVMCVGYFKGGTMNCRWRTSERYKDCNRIFKKICKWKTRYHDHNRDVQHLKYFRLERTGVLRYALTFERVCMIDDAFILDCFDLSSHHHNHIVRGARKSNRRIDLKPYFNISDPEGLKLVSSTDRLCVFQGTTRFCERSHNGMNFEVSSSETPVNSFIHGLNRNVRPLTDQGVHPSMLPPSQRKDMFLYEDGVLDDAPPRVPPIREVASTGSYNCATFM